MVGDRDLDVCGAAALGLPAIGVSWGYSAPGELERPGRWLLRTPPVELLALLT